MKFFLLVFALSFGLLFSAFAAREPVPSFEEELAKEAILAKKYLFQNFSRRDAAPGSIVAATTKNNPNYYYHWVRDAEIAFGVALSLYDQSDVKPFLREFIPSSIRFNKILQASENLSGGLGEPKFHVDGSVYNEPWGRPQNDGPALRALSMMRLYRLIQRDSRLDKELLNELYDSRIPARSLIKSDLEFVAHHWSETSFDLWEEVRGMHFFTLLVQSSALKDGAEFARSLGDPAAADFYLQEEEKIAGLIRTFWDSNKGYIVATKYIRLSLSMKDTQLDSAVLLGSILGGRSDFYGPGFDQVLRTMVELQKNFSLYPVNQEYNGVAFGRYPGDTYDGYQTDSIGNPWFLTTHAAAEFLYRTAQFYGEQGFIKISNVNRPFFEQFQKLKRSVYLDGEQLSSLLESIRLQADVLMARSLFHKDAQGRMSEQINRNHGFMQGAENLTWSYASYLSAFEARKTLLRQGKTPAQQ